MALYQVRLITTQGATLECDFIYDDLLHSLYSKINKEEMTAKKNCNYFTIVETRSIVIKSKILCEQKVMV